MLPRDPAPGSKSAREANIGWRMAGVGIQTGSEALAGALLGYGVDYYFQTGGWGLLIGGVLGIVVGMASLIRGSLKVNREFEEARREGKR